MKRIGAVVIAVGLVLGAVVIRDRIEGDDAARPSTRVRPCATQLAEVCAGLRPTTWRSSGARRRTADALRRWRKGRSA